MSMKSFLSTNNCRGSKRGRIMVTTGIQQIQLRNCFKNEATALEALKEVKASGLEGIELNGFMIRRLSLPIKMLLWAAKRHVGNSDRLDC